MDDYLDIDRIAFIGRTFDEYMGIFGLDESCLREGPVLDCPAGASSFTAEACRAGIDATACDVLYDRTADELADKGRQDIRHVFERLDEVSHLYTWEYYNSKDEVVAYRNRALELFIGDFSGSAGQRYKYAQLPHLPFPDGKFPLVLSGHFLFLYGDRLDPDFHKACLRELVRVSSGEARIFPLTGLDAKPYPFLGDLLACLRGEGMEAEIVRVPFEFQRGACRMLKLRRKSPGGI